MLYVASFLVFLSTGLLISGILMCMIYKEKIIEKLKYFDDDYIAKEKVRVKKKSGASIFKNLAQYIPHFKVNEKHVSRLEMEMLKADVPITVEELLVIKILSSTVISFLFYIISKNYIFMLIIFSVAWNVPKFIIMIRKKERIKNFDFQLNEGISIISNSLKAGYSFLQAVSVVVEETKDPFSKEFKKLLKEMRLGIPEDEALKNLLGRMESDDLKLIINAILIQKDIGGNLSEILDNISETIRERQKIQGELKTLTAQGKLSGIIVMLIPIFLGGIIYLFNKQYILLLFTTPMGIGMIAACIFNQFLGLIMIRKIISIDM